MLRLFFLCAAALSQFACASTGRAPTTDWVYAVPERQEVVAAFLADSPANVPCDWGVLLAAGPGSPLDSEIRSLLAADPGRWEFADCGTLQRVCAMGTGVRDHGLDRWADIWQRFCEHGARCQTRRSELVALEAGIAGWQPPAILAPLPDWPQAVSRYAAHLADHAPEVAAPLRRHLELGREEAADRCRWAVEYAQAVAGTALDLMDGDERAPRFIAGDLARTDADPGAFLERLVPHSRAYSNLVEAYRRYRLLAADEGFDPLTESYQNLRRARRRDLRHRVLASRLVAEGLLDEVPGGEGPIPFGRTLEDALKRFQRMHHLSQTGAIGPATLAALNVPAAAKREGLRRALAGYRKAVPPWESTFVLVQMPAAFLEYYVGGELRRHQRTVLGRPELDDEGARPLATPVLNSSITAVIFNPEWHVPWSIAVNELEPIIEKDPAYLARNHYRREIPGKNRVRYIQSPGPHNALGRVKFHFANSHDVYLHDTPQKHSFRLPRRLLSHGCVRVEKAVKVATLMLSLDQGFNWENLERVLKSGETTEYRLKIPVPVHLLYTTAAADSNGDLHFLPDTYEREQAP